MISNIVTRGYGSFSFNYFIAPRGYLGSIAPIVTEPTYAGSKGIKHAEWWQHDADFEEQEDRNNRIAILMLMN